MFITRRTVWAGFFFALVLLVALGAGFAFWATRPQPSQGAPVQTVALVPVNATATTTPNVGKVADRKGWATYTGKYFSIQYPASWEYADRQDKGVVFDPEHVATFSATGGTVSGLVYSEGDFARERPDNLGKVDAQFFNTMYDGHFATRTFGGLTATGALDRSYVDTVVMSFGGRVYLFRYIQKNNNTPLHREEFNAMLASIRFKAL